ncbi:hypothetical protein MA20_42665 [Bradyrhizobium japonicum]|uniref:Uncharacterized protein n=1 Tax=Bradyrhizobium japonicum TaxID=375 RepID=A0A0A3XGV4_BRAJP|nr:hypothetical protein MA20_42665 [Bradyrhizobium japonicum]
MAAVTDIPIMFSTPMILALLAGRKLMTRRLAWKGPVIFHDPPDGGDALASKLQRRGWNVSDRYDVDHRIAWPPSPWQKVKAGDRLWVREEWRVGKTHDAKSPKDLPERKCTIMFTAGGSMGNATGGWTPDPNYPSCKPNTFPFWSGRRRASMHLPRWGSRITLLVNSTKIERLQSISDDDCFAEGLEPFGERDPDGRIFHNPLQPNECGLGAWAFGELWKHLHGTESWDANPEVVALGFSIVHANIDAPEALAA